MQGCRPALFGKKLHHAAVKIGCLLIGGMAKPFIEIQFAVFDLSGKFHRGGGTDDFGMRMQSLKMNMAVSMRLVI